LTENNKADRRGSAKYVNPVSLGTLYLSFSLLLWSSEQISDSRIFGIAIFTTTISFIYFTSVFWGDLLSKLNKWVQKPLILLTFFVFLFSYTLGWLQAFLETSGPIRSLIAYFGFAWIVVFLLTLIRDTVKQGKPQRLFIFLIIAILLIIAGIKFYYHDLWSGAYLVAIAGLALAVALNRLKVHGGIFE
jgi:hypothetical protein